MDSPHFVKLMACARAIEGDYLELADSMFEEIRSLIAAETDSGIRKVVNYFSQALARRVYRLYPPNHTSPPTLSSHPCSVFGYAFSTLAFETIGLAFLHNLDGPKRVHIVLISILDMSDWGWMMFSILEIMNYPAVRLTMVGSTITDAEMKTAEFASYGKKWEFQQRTARTAVEIVECVNKLRRTGEDETIIVIWLLQFHKLLALPGAIEQVLLKLKDLKAERIFILEQEVDNSGSFVNRLVQSFQFYSAVFDMLENHKSLIWNNNEAWDNFFRRQIDNVVALEGTDRVVRHETFAQWANRLHLSGFRQIHLPSNLNNPPFRPKYRREVKNGCLMSYWNNQPLFVGSVWKPDATTQFNERNDIDHPITIQDTSPPFLTFQQYSEPSSSDADDDNELNSESMTLESKTWSIEEIRKYLKIPFEEKEERRIAQWMSRNIIGEVAIGRNKKLNVSDTSLEKLLNIPPLDLLDEMKEQYYIDDSVIDAYFELLMKRSKKFSNLYVKSYSLSTLISYFLLQGKWKELEAAFSHLNIKEMQGISKLFMPVCLHNHWILICIDFEQQKLLWLNPLISQLLAYQIEKDIICRWVTDYLLPSLGYINLQGWQFQEDTNIPIQQSLVDCGIFVMKYADCLAHGNHDFPFTQVDMPHFRRRIFLDICKGKIVLPK